MRATAFSPKIWRSLKNAVVQVGGDSPSIKLWAWHTLQHNFLILYRIPATLKVSGSPLQRPLATLLHIGHLLHKVVITRGHPLRRYHQVLLVDTTKDLPLRHPLVPGQPILVSLLLHHPLVPGQPIISSRPPHPRIKAIPLPCLL